IALPPSDRTGDKGSRFLWGKEALLHQGVDLGDALRVVMAGTAGVVTKGMLGRMHQWVFHWDHQGHGTRVLLTGRRLLGRTRGCSLQQAQAGAWAGGVLGLYKRINAWAFDRSHAGQPASEVARIPGTRVQRIGDGGGDEAVDIQGRQRDVLVALQVVLDADMVAVQEHLLVLRLEG
ncbi:MAG: hypothetical protein H0U76_11130, partial [Ktedonobacteraceae bacterium]|nr:hypothetical protein [Ktedonobacteraceae bacterium]